ncbi:hypothetical protein D7Y06_20260 [Roseburia sp. 1XD42-69]|nr:hypothetical protein D7Y06_20260 [Roseburia sp. 1XD42-69]
MHDMGMDRGQIMGNYFPTFQVISLTRPPGLPTEKSRPPHMADEVHSAAVLLIILLFSST